MKQRLSIKEIEPNAYKGLLELEKYLAQSSLSVLTKEMIKIRASQINGCAYCIEMHTATARKAGETEQRIYALSAWWESPLFSDEEKSILAITDEVTLISKRGLTDKTFEEAKKYFDDNTIAQLIMQVITINAWNRVAVSTHMFHQH